MNVPPLPPTGGAGGPPGHSGPTHPGGSDLPFVTGQRLLVQVVQAISPSQAVLDVGCQRFLVSTPQPLTAGQVLEVTVKALAPVLELLVAEPSVTFSSDAYALAAVLTARAASAGRAAITPGEVRAFLRLLGGGAESMSTPALATAREQLATLLLPVDVGRHGSSLPEALRERLVRSGLLLEARLAAHLNRGGPDPAAHAAAAVQDDLRVLLARVASESSERTEAGVIRQRIADAVVASQVETAFYRMKEGEWRVDIPTAFGAVETDVQLRVRQDAPRPRGDRSRQGHAIELTVNHPDLGTVRAAAHWMPPDLQVRFAVDARAVDILKHEAGALASSLRARGFRDVSVTVDISPDAPPPAPDDPSEMLPGGSILNARA